MSLDKEEKEFVKSYELDEWVDIDSSEKENIIKWSRNSLLKNKRINIRISEIDLNKLKSKAVREGIPYQTLVSSLLHKYVSGQLKEV